jgi:hypothetical protein
VANSRETLLGVRKEIFGDLAVNPHLGEVMPGNKRSVISLTEALA